LDPLVAFFTLDSFVQHYCVELEIDFFPAQPVLFSEILNKIICVHWILKTVLIVHCSLGIDETGISICTSYLQALGLSQNLAAAGAWKKCGIINLDLLLVGALGV
jgi:protein tyrosine phosphatase